jgi:putative PIN family toxin of toxin-antitoxin system
VKVVLDTNVLIAAFISHGACNELLEHCAINHEVFISSFILSEVKEKLMQKFDYTGQESDEVVTLLESRFTVVAPVELGSPVCRDLDDDTILGTALAGGCDCIITGDKDLLTLKNFRKMRIINPADFWAIEN